MAALQVLFVHGMGRSPRSAWLLLRQLRQQGFDTHTFAYQVRRESFAQIVTRLCQHLEQLNTQGDCVLIGHSLGGVLLRAALQGSPHLPPPRQVFLLGSPQQPSRLAQHLCNHPLFMKLTGDCGGLLASTPRMAAVGSLPPAQTIAIIGTRDLPLSRRFFGGEANDGVVARAEVAAEWLTQCIEVPVLHTWLPSSPRVASLILQRLHDLHTTRPS